MVTKEQVLNMLAHIEDPELHRSLTDLNMVRDVLISDGVVSITLALTVPNCPLRDQIEADLLTLETPHFPHTVFTSSPSPFGRLHLETKTGAMPLNQQEMKK